MTTHATSNLPCMTILEKALCKGFPAQTDDIMAMTYRELTTTLDQLQTKIIMEMTE
jgi:hypothetical protein